VLYQLSYLTIRSAQIYTDCAARGNKRRAVGRVS